MKRMRREVIIDGVDVSDSVVDSKYKRNYTSCIAKNTGGFYPDPFSYWKIKFSDGRVEDFSYERVKVTFFGDDDIQDNPFLGDPPEQLEVGITLNGKYWSGEDVVKMEQENNSLKEQNIKITKALDTLLWKCVEVDSDVVDSDAWHEAERFVK